MSDDKMMKLPVGAQMLAALAQRIGRERAEQIAKDSEGGPRGPLGLEACDFYFDVAATRAEYSARDFMQPIALAAAEERWSELLAARGSR